jgi:hypothetical protein
MDDIFSNKANPVSKKLKMKVFTIPFFILILLGSNSLNAQQSFEVYTIIDYPAVPPKFCDLEEEMKETSGIIFYDNRIWTINDSGGEPIIYKIDKESGAVIQKVIILNGENKDWEDISEDDQSIYVGDFGNNYGDRKDLKIYKVAKSDISGKKKIEVKAEIIEFSFRDQLSFEFENHAHNFDCESLIVFDDSLIVFSKNWVDGKTRMYKMPKIAGQYQLDPTDTFDADGLITGADYSSNLKKLVLSGYKDFKPFIFLVNDFDGKSLNGKEIFRFNLFKMKESQVEGIAWSTGETVLFSTEHTKTYPQQVFEFDIQEVFKVMGK